MIWDVGSWDPLKTLKGHKGAVVDVSIHPSGKLALSIGRDKTLYTWNLLKGRSAFAINFKQIPTAVRWFDAGQRYAVALERKVQLYSTGTGQVYHELELPTKALDMAFGGSGDGWVAVGSNDDTIRLFNAVTGEVCAWMCCLVLPPTLSPTCNVACSPFFMMVWLGSEICAFVGATALLVCARVCAVVRA